MVSRDQESRQVLAGSYAPEIFHKTAVKAAAKPVFLSGEGSASHLTWCWQHSGFSKLLDPFLISYKPHFFVM